MNGNTICWCCWICHEVFIHDKCMKEYKEQHPDALYDGSYKLKPKEYPIYRPCGLHPKNDLK